MSKVKHVHISLVRCWNCKHLQRDPYTHSYKCIRNRVLPDVLPEHFASKCVLYEGK